MLPAVAAEKIHLPFGRPVMLQPDQRYCVLHHQGFISAYSHTMLMPLWSSFTIHKPVSTTMRGVDSPLKTTSLCG